MAPRLPRPRPTKACRAHSSESHRIRSTQRFSDDSTARGHDRIASPPLAPAAPGSAAKARREHPSESHRIRAQTPNASELACYNISGRRCEAAPMAHGTHRVVSGLRNTVHAAPQPFRLYSHLSTARCLPGARPEGARTPRRRSSAQLRASSCTRLSASGRERSAQGPPCSTRRSAGAHAGFHVPRRHHAPRLNWRRPRRPSTFCADHPRSTPRFGGRPRSLPPSTHRPSTLHTAIGARPPRPSTLHADLRQPGVAGRRTRRTLAFARRSAARAAPLVDRARALDGVVPARHWAHSRRLGVVCSLLRQ